ncbi:MAG: PAS domain S-box protein [Sphingobacteriales bacterium]|uniref:PAS domain-containing sensor histidine kinase n=1 Tax=Hydrotalea flava TaxID=714549 RepID=UPI000FAEAC8D|nr:PAS domain S-box protein [Hydrotalea flava]RTL51234.1 MAG: PAS domain S-box protein [Sphingobacteriales bacterium]
MDTTLPAGNEWSGQLWAHVLQPMLIADAKGAVHANNPAFVQLTGGPVADGLRHSVLQLLNWEISYWQKLCADVQNNTVASVTTNMQILGEAAIPVSVHCTMLAPEKECLLLLQITDLREKLANEALVQSADEKYRYLFLNNPLALILWDLETLQIIDVNYAACKEYGYARRDFVKLSMKDIHPPENLPDFLKFAADFANTDKQKKKGVWIHQNALGKKMWMETVSHKIVYDNRQAVMAMLNNVTEKLALEQQLVNEQLLRQQQIAEAVIAAQEKERSEFSQELHDNVNQLLIASRIYVESARQHPNREENLLSQASGFILKSIEEIRKLSKALVTPLETEMSLQEGLEKLAADIRELKSLQIETRITDFEETGLTYPFKINIYRIAQEQFNNIIKHSGAKKVILSLQRNENYVLFSIEDSGIGFDVNSQRKGIGINNMLRRAEMYNGVVEIDSAPGKGCKIHIQFRLK